MTRRLNRICLLALLATVLAATAAAQQAKPIANWANLSQLVAGSEIRITLAAGKTMRGFVERVTAESLAIDATTSQEMLSRQDNRLGLPAIKLWAYDHVCLFGWPLPLPASDDRSFIY